MLKLNLKKFTPKGTVLPLTFFTLFFLVNAILGYFSIRNIEQNQQNINLSLSNINVINGIFVELLRAETGQRGYLLTDLESYIEPYLQANTVIDTRLRELLEADFDEIQQENLYELQLLIEARLDEMGSTIELARQNRDSEAIQLLFSHRGRDLMNEISSKISQMENYENQLYAQRLEATQNSRASSFYIILTANLVGLVMVFVTLSLIRKNMQKEQEFTSSLKEANDNLEAKVDERTAVLSHYSNELKRSNRELQDFAFVASHDLQEPLRKIRSFGDRLQANFSDKLGEQGKDYIERMQKSSERMSTLIEDLLSFSRITTKAEPFISISLQDTLEEVLDDLEIALEESGASINVESLPVIEADRSQMKQLFQNLIGNAIKFRDKDKAPEISVTSSFLNDDQGGTGWTEITVSDNGIGFDEKYVSKIFTPFQRLHGKDDYSGTGIGLAVCRRIVERHGGSINARSMPGEGSIFTIKLPLGNHDYANRSSSPDG